MTTQVTSSTLLPEQEFAKACELTFKAFDTDRDQILSKKEFNVLLAQVKGLNFPMTQALADYLYNLVDLKKDGKIDLQEFYSVMKNYYNKK